MRPSVVRTHFFGDGVSEWWVRRNVAPAKKIKLGHSTAGWWERDVEEWLDSRSSR